MSEAFMETNIAYQQATKQADALGQEDVHRIDKLEEVAKQAASKVEKIENTCRELEKRNEVLEKKVETLERDVYRLSQENYTPIKYAVDALSVQYSALELEFYASLGSTHNGALLWCIPKVRKRIKDAKMGRITSIYSTPFYTGRNGYKCCIRAYLNGDGTGEGTHLSIYFVLMRGENDPLLQWPFKPKVSLILVDQDYKNKKHLVRTFKPTAQSSSFQKPITDMNIGSGCPEFAKLSVLDNTRYVRDDVMYIKAIVDTSRILHP